MENKKSISKIAKISDRRNQEPKERNFKILEFKNQRIITTKVLAEQFGTEEVNISKNFKRNETRFIEGKHFFKLQGEALKEFKTTYLKDDSSMLRINCLYLWTDRGAARHAKILDTDEAWDVYEALEENYFNPREKQLSPMDQLRLQYEVLEEHEERFNKLENKIDSLELNPSQRKQIQNARHKKVSELLGGTKSLAYKDVSFRSRVYSDLGRAFNNYFDVPTYDCTPRNKFREALEVIDSYNLSTQLNMELKAINNQTAFDEVACTK